MRTFGLTLLVAALLAWPVPARGAKVVWLCDPASRPNPCTAGLGTTVLSPDGDVLGRQKVTAARRAPVDCFYLYPTVSAQPRPVATLRIDPEERGIARLQASQYSRLCNVYAPMYRQQTIAGLSAGNATPKQMAIAYRSVLAGWRAFLRRSAGRGFVLIGHSQGSELLRRLIAAKIDPVARLRRRLLSAQLPGGNIAVRKGDVVGGDFQNIPACLSPPQLGCVVAYSAFNEAVPADTLYGRVNGPFNPGDPDKLDVLCTNPAALAGGAAPLQPLFTRSGEDLGAIGVPPANVATPWFALRGAYTGECSDADGAHVLQVTGSPALAPFPDATWGLHLGDVNLALGDLLARVRAEIRAYTTRA